MKRNKKIIIPIGMMSGDYEALKWAELISNLSETEEVRLTYYLTKDKWEENANSYPSEELSRRDSAMEYMENLISDYWDGHPGADIHCDVVDGASMLYATLREISTREADLVVLSREAIGSDIAVRIIRKSTCSVLMVPEGSKPEFKKILVPTDLSDLSKYAFDVASAFARTLDEPVIHSIHGYDIGKRPHKVMLPEEELLEMSRSFATREHDLFTSNLPDYGVEIKTSEHFSDYIPTLVSGYTKEVGCDLIVLSCRGSKTMMGWLLGTIPENLIRESDVPVLAVKMKNTGASLLRQLLSSNENVDKPPIPHDSAPT